jgi:hypothetical protein
VHEIKFNDV